MSRIIVKFFFFFLFLEKNLRDFLIDLFFFMAYQPFVDYLKPKSIFGIERIILILRVNIALTNFSDASTI